MKRYLFCFLLLIINPFFLFIAFSCALISRFHKKNEVRIVWGSTPIINNVYWSRAMALAGIRSETFTHDFYSLINNRTDWDRILSEEYRWVPRRAKSLIAFVHSLFCYDVFFISFNGFFIGSTFARYWQSEILKLAGKKIIVIPYGSDSYMYDRIRSTGVLHGLLMSYPFASRDQLRIRKNVDYWCSRADAIIPGFMGPDGFGRWDVLIPSQLMIDLELWTESSKVCHANGRNGVVVIVHAPNHRGFKGTEFLIEAVSSLQAEGLMVELRLLERLQNSEVRRVLNEDADILVEQLIFTGHGMNGLEGMASGLPTVSNLEDDTYVMPMRRWSYFNECPLVSASPETLVNVLRKLITRPELRRELGRAGRAYVEKYHGLDSAQYLFTNVIEYVYGRKESLINLYHPILGEYPNRSPKIQHPLLNSRIVD
jgi:glycosyltransferase involved in cell wall biosynthesis